MTSKDGAGAENTSRALLRDLHDLGRLDDRDDAFRQDLRALLSQQAQQQTAYNTERTPQMETTVSQAHTLAPRRSRPLRLRVASIATAVLLALSGVIGYLRWQAPTPVSAQMILRGTAAALRSAAPDQVTHDVSTVHTISAPGISAGVSGLTNPDVTVNQWTQRDVHGFIARQDTLFTDPKGTVLQHTVQNGTMIQIYTTQAHYTVVMTTTPSLPAQDQVIPDPFDTASLRQFVLDAQQGTGHDARVLPNQTLDGVTVYVIQVIHTLPVDPQVNAATTPRQYTVTLCVDKGSYAIHKLEEMAVNAKGQFLTSSTMRVVRHEVMPVSAVPAGIFTLHTPAGTRTQHTP